MSETETVWGYTNVATTPETDPDEVGGTDWETIRRFGRRLVFSEPEAPDDYEVYGSDEEAHTEFVFRLKNMLAMAAEGA